MFIMSAAEPPLTAGTCPIFVENAVVRAQEEKEVGASRRRPEQEEAALDMTGEQRSNSANGER